MIERCISWSLVAILGSVTICLGASAEGTKEIPIQDRFPGLTSGAFSFATLGELPSGVLVESGDVQVTVQELDESLVAPDATVKQQLDKNKLFLLENIATRKLLLQAARGEVTGDSSASLPEEELIQKSLEGIAAGVQVTDGEVAKFYEENKEMCGGASLDQIMDQLKEYVLGQKKQDVVTNYIRTLGQRAPIVLAAEWVDREAKLAMDNSVDKARTSGKPSLVDFGATGCVPCDMMAPILETLKSKHAGKLNVVFVHVREEQILASRYGIESIPVQIFFDKNGKEINRHTGFFAQPEIEKKLAELGVQ